MREITVFLGTSGAKTKPFGVLPGPSAFKIDFATEFSSTDRFSPDTMAQQEIKPPAPFQTRCYEN
jgi:hypothetical protein